MEYTKNYNLKKPSEEDFYNVNDFNSNSEIVDTELNKLDQIIKILQDGINAAELLKKIKEVDGAGSGLDADTVDGLNTGYHPTNTFIPTVYGSVLEIGKYIDFHEIGSPKDFDGRLSVNNNYPYWQPDGAGLSRIALADGILQTNLNADLLDGKDSSYFARTGFGNGGEFSRQLTGDCLNVKDGGIYVNQIFTGLNMQNAPSTGQWYHYHQYVITDMYVVILAIPATEGNPLIRRRVQGAWKDWEEVGGDKMFTIPRKFEVSNPTANQTLFSYNGGAGEVITISSSNYQPSLIIDGVELNPAGMVALAAGFFPFSSASDAALCTNVRIKFKNSIQIKSRGNNAFTLGLVMTEK